MTSETIRIVVDENIPRQLVAALRDAGLKVIDAVRIAPGGTDAALLALAHREQAILLTGDLDFPRLIFADGHPPPVTLIVERRQPCDADRLRGDVLRVVKLGSRMHGHVVVLDADDERVRSFPPQV